MPFEITADVYVVTVTPKVPSTLTVVPTRTLSFTIDTGTEQITVKSTVVAASVPK